MITFVVTYTIFTVLAILHIILYGSRPAKSLSWLLIVLIVPLFGILLYILFGMNRRRIKFFELRQTVKRKLYNKTYRNPDTSTQPVEFENYEKNKLAKLLYRSTDFACRPGNAVDILFNGKETFERIFEAIENAKHFIHLQYYIFEEGELQERFLQLFKKKIEEGVEVRMLYDAIGSYHLDSKVKKKLQAIGVQLYTTMSLSYGSFIFTLNYRNHRKIIIIDGIEGFTGGVNVSDKYIKSIDDLGIWDDTHVRLRGPIVDSLHRVFIKDYYFATKEKELLLDKKYIPKAEIQGDTIVQIVTSGPDSNQPAIMQQYISMINLAKEYIYISNPYFIPNTAMLEAIRIAALSGVKVKLLTPKKTDSWLAKNSMLSYFEELLAIGVAIYQQTDEFLHSKVIVIDGEIASVGSGNFDHRSFEHNFETNALIYDQKIAQQICDHFVVSYKKAIELEYETYKNRSIHHKLAEGIARFFSPLL